MALIQIRSVDAPLNRRALIGPALGLVRRALATGLLRDAEVIDTLDLELVRTIAREASSAGIGQDAAAELLGRPTPARLGALIGRLDDALTDSPLPERELGELTRVLGADLLAALAGISTVSLRRYAARARSVPDLVAARVHLLALVVADLAGAYNELGIRRWFERPRSQLGGKSPRRVLRGSWTPDDADVRAVQTLAEALAGPGAAT
jgi:hypothetical protein